MHENPKSCLARFCDLRLAKGAKTQDKPAIDQRAPLFNIFHPRQQYGEKFDGT